MSVRRHSKLAGVLITWMAAYPIVLLAQAVLAPVAAAWPLPARTFALTALVVPLLSWVGLPLAEKLFDRLRLVLTVAVAPRARR